nr:hypothetical protein [Tanacetum cinerariifolium]
QKILSQGTSSSIRASEEFPLPEQLPTAYEDKFLLLIQSDATIKKIALLLKTGVTKFGNSYEAPTTDAATGLASGGTATKKERTVALTTKDMQKRKNDIKARTTLLLALPDEHQLQFSKSDLDTMSLDDLYNHLKVYESEVQKKSKSNSQNMAFISSAKNSNGKEDVNTTSIPTASTNVSPTSVNIGAKKTGKKISIQRTDVVRFDKLKVECFNCHKMGHFARECRAPRSQDMGRRDNYRQGSKVEEHAPKALMGIDRVGWDWSIMKNEKEDYALVADEEALTKFTLMAKTSAESKVKGRLVEFKNQKIKFCEKIRVLEFKVESKTERIEYLTNELEMLKKEKGDLDNKLTGFQTASKDLDNLLESQRSDKNKEGPSPAIESNSDDLQNKNPSVTETGASSSTILSKPAINFAKAAERPTESKIDKDETNKKPAIKYAELYRKTSKRSDLDTMSLDDLYNHLKVYESEVQKKSKSNSQSMAFISSAKHSSGNEEVNTASVSTAITNVSPASANIGAANDMEKMDIKWNMTLLSMSADRFWKKTGKKITIQGTDVAGFDKSKVCHRLKVD